MESVSRIGVVIVNFRSHAETVLALDAARASLGDLLESAVIVENGSGEEGLLAGSPAEIVPLPMNRGFAAGVNAGIERTLRASPGLGRVMILNPDAILEPGPWGAWIDSAMEHDAALAPRIQSQDGATQASTYGPLSQWRTLLEAVGIHSILHRAGIRRAAPEGRAEVHAAQGSCLLLSMRAWREIGPFDERFFLYHEEADWCARARTGGFRIIYDPSVTVTHEKGMTIPGGREQVYYTGLILLVRKRFGDDAAESYRRRLHAALGLAALASRSRDRFDELRRVAREL